LSAKRTPELGGIPELPVAQSTPPPAQGNPFVQTGTQEHSFHTQFVFDINKQVAKLETGLEHIEKRLDKVEVKIDLIQSDVSALKSSVETLSQSAKTVGKGIWAVFILLATFGLSVLSFWIKHKMGW